MASSQATTSALNQSPILQESQRSALRIKPRKHLNGYPRSGNVCYGLEALTRLGQPEKPPPTERGRHNGGPEGRDALRPVVGNDVLWQKQRKASL